MSWLQPMTDCPNLGWGFLAVSDDGVVVGGAALGCNGYRWTEEIGVTEIGALPGCSPYSLPYGISGDGRVLVGVCYFDFSLRNGAAFRWTEADGMSPLGDLPGGEVHSWAWDASYDGSTIVGESVSVSNTAPRETEAFVWKTGAGIAPLGDLPGGVFDSSASGVSADGSVIVGFGTDDAGQQAFIWTADTGMRNLRDLLVNQYKLDLSGWTLREAIGVAANGRVIAGNGINPDGFLEAWVASLGPCLGDFNRSSSITSQDFFDFLGAFLAGEAQADINQDGAITSQDFFDFLVAFFTGCP